MPWLLEGLCLSMSKKIYIGVGDLAKEVDPLYVSVGGSTKKISKVYVGVDGIARQAYPKTVTHKWNRYNITTTYYWNRYNVNRTYKWNRYTCTTKYSWRYYSVDGSYTYSSDYERYAGGVSPSATGECAKGFHYGYRKNGDLIIIYDNIVPMASVRNVEGTYYLNSIDDDSYMDNDGYMIIGGDCYSYYDNGLYHSLYGKFRRITISSNGQAKVYSSWTLGDPEMGTYLGTVESSSSSAYPDNGIPQEVGEYYYGNRQTIYDKGSYNGQVSSSSSGSYPSNGVSGSYWYVSAGSTTSRGSANGSVSSSSNSSYPSNGISGSYWYVYDKSFQSQGSANGSVTSTNRSQYPDNGVSGSYWYVYAGTV